MLLAQRAEEMRPARHEDATGPRARRRIGEHARRQDAPQLAQQRLALRSRRCTSTSSSPSKITTARWCWTCSMTSAAVGGGRRRHRSARRASAGRRGSASSVGSRELDVAEPAQVEVDRQARRAVAAAPAREQPAREDLRRGRLAHPVLAEDHEIRPVVGVVGPLAEVVLDIDGRRRPLRGRAGGDRAVCAVRGPRRWVRCRRAPGAPSPSYRARPRAPARGAWRSGRAGRRRTGPRAGKRYRGRGRA